MSKTSNNAKRDALEAWMGQLQRETNQKGNTKQQRNAKSKFQYRYKSNY